MKDFLDRFRVSFPKIRNLRTAMSSPNLSSSAFQADLAGRARDGARVDWVDHAKGLCIIFVVMMHATLGVEAAAGEQGWMHAIVQFAKPFRMPDFFMISGLFLGLVIARPWRRYLDRKVVHFAYFYVLWVSLQFLVKTPLWLAEGQPAADIAANFAMSFIQPFGTLWFIYLLPVFFVVTRLLVGVPWWLLLGAAALLEILPIHTGWMVADEFAARYVYFLAGYLFATRIFEIAQWVRDHVGFSLALLAGWFALNLWATFTPASLLIDQPLSGRSFEFISDLPVISLGLGAAGALAIIGVTALAARLPALNFLGYLGRHSIVVYLAFFFPMVVSRIVLLKLAPWLDIGTASMLVTLAGVAGPVILHFFIQRTGYGKFLFERPDWAKIDAAQENAGTAKAVPAE